MSRSLRTAILVLLMSPMGCERTQSASTMARLDPEDGAELIDEYLLRDSRGDRLRASDWFDEHVRWSEEPGWDEYSVLDSQTIERVSADSQTVRCLAIQRTLGSVSSTDTLFITFREGPSVDTIMFEATATESGWRLASPRYNPHLSLRSASADPSLGESSRMRLQELLRSRMGGSTSAAVPSRCSYRGTR